MATPLPPKIMQLDSRTQEWADWRAGKDLDGFPRIMATDASVIAGRDPYTTIQKLWQQQTGRIDVVVQDTVDTRHALDAYNTMFGEQLSPVCIEHPEVVWAASSLHGLSLPGDELLEIRIPDERNRNLAKAGIVPANWWGEVQWKLFCCPTAKVGYYWSYCSETHEGVRLAIAPDLEFQRWLWDITLTYRNCLIQGTSPPEDDAWAQTAKRWLALKQQIEADTSRLETIQAELINLMPESMKRHEGNGVSVLKIQKEESIDYTAFLKSIRTDRATVFKAFMASRDIDGSALAAFKQPPSTQYRVTKTNEPLMQDWEA